MDILIMAENGKANKSDEKVINEVFVNEKITYDDQCNVGWVVQDIKEFDARIKCLRLRGCLSKTYVGALQESFFNKTPVIEYITINTVI